MSVTSIVKSLPSELKKEVRKAFNGPNHSSVYDKLEQYLGEHFCVYEDGTVYAVAKRIAGVA